MKVLLLIILSFSVSAQDWSLVGDLAPDGASTSDYGTDMVMFDDYLVVGWPKIFEEALSGAEPSGCGEVITYKKESGKFVEMSRITAENLQGSCTEGDGFGFSLAFDAGRLAIGMPAGARTGMGQPGGGTDADSAVFMTHFDDGNWVLDEMLQADDLGNGKGMGMQLVLEGDVLLSHANEYDSIFGFSFITSTGVYVFENSGSGFMQTQKLSENFHLFGQDFDYGNDQIVVGAWGEQTLTAPGQVYVYEKEGSAWGLVQTISDTRNSNLGNQIEILGGTLAVGAVQAGGSGSVSIFEQSGGQWQESQFIQASDARFNDQFGITVRLFGDEMVVGATSATNTDPSIGGAYTFKKDSNGEYVESQKIEGAFSNGLNDQHGGNLIFNETDLIINDTSGGTIDGAVTELAHFSRPGDDTGGGSYAVNSKSSGVYSVGGTGQQLNFEVLPDDRVVMYGQFNHQGDMLWATAVGSYQGDTMMFEEVYSTSGATFGGSFDSTQVSTHVLGTAMISFSACKNAVFNYDFSGIGTGVANISKVTETPGNECGSINKVLPTRVSGSWYNPSRSGEGFSLYLFEEFGVQKAQVTWYTYDDSGNQMFMTGIGEVMNQSVSIEELTSFDGANFLEGQVRSQIMGSMNLSWSACAQATGDYDLSESGFGTGDLNLVALTHLKNTDCGDL